MSGLWLYGDTPSLQLLAFHFSLKPMHLRFAASLIQHSLNIMCTGRWLWCVYSLHILNTKHLICPSCIAIALQFVTPPPYLTCPQSCWPWWSSAWCRSQRCPGYPDTSWWWGEDSRWLHTSEIGRDLKMFLLKFPTIRISSVLYPDSWYLVMLCAKLPTFSQSLLAELVMEVWWNIWNMSRY